MLKMRILFLFLLDEENIFYAVGINQLQRVGSRPFSKAKNKSGDEAICLPNSEHH
jgi:hypothetical protein